MEARGKGFRAAAEVHAGAYGARLQEESLFPNRTLSLKRVDWNLNGERNPQNRGVSKYKRISWDEAIDIIASEIKRIIKTYGPYAILAQGRATARRK